MIPPFPLSPGQSSTLAALGTFSSSCRSSSSSSFFRFPCVLFASSRSQVFASQLGSCSFSPFVLVRGCIDAAFSSWRRFLVPSSMILSMDADLLEPSVPLFGEAVP